MKRVFIALCVLAISIVISACSQTTPQPPLGQKPPLEHQPLKIMAYYTGDGSDLGRYHFEQMTHVIYSFLHLQGNQLAFDKREDQQALQRLVALKQNYPALKIIVSLGGWGGCETCSTVFASRQNRLAFAQSVVKILRANGADGIDLDWEYPAVEGFPGHTFGPTDQGHFTELVKTLRQTLGSGYEISFAAGGFDNYLNNAVNWAEVMPLVDSVNLMSYDLVNGFSKVTGHHTSLYSTPEQKDSTDNGVKALLARGVTARKIVIGAAFYSRTWTQVADINHGLYQPGVHVEGAGYSEFPERMARAAGWQFFWDDQAKAPYAYNRQTQTFASFDDTRSVTEKVRYAERQQLGGIMFWQLSHDRDKTAGKGESEDNPSLVNAIFQAQ